MQIRGLTLWQPMAWAVAAGHKPIENRPWRPYRDVTHVAIHAGQRWHRIHEMQIRRLLGIDVPKQAHRHGCIIAVARIAGVVTKSDSPWFSGPYGWVLDEVVALDDPVPCKGSLGLWRLPIIESVKMEKQLPREHYAV